MKINVLGCAYFLAFLKPIQFNIQFSQGSAGTHSCQGVRIYSILA